jgi:hypothetical protein
MSLPIVSTMMKKIKMSDTPPHFLKDSNANLKMKTTEKGIGVHSLVYNTLGVKGRAGALG